MKPTHLLGAVAAAAVLAFASVTVSVSVTAPAVAAAAAAQDDTVQTSNGPLVIHPVHHAGLVLTWNGCLLYTSPSPRDS